MVPCRCRRVDRRPASLDSCLVFTDIDGRLSMLFEWMWSLQPAGTTADCRHQQRVFRLRAAELHRQLQSHKYADTSPPQDSRVDHIKRYLVQNMHRNLDLAEVARTIPCSREHVIRLFKKAVGMTLYQYLQDLRLTRRGIC